MVDLLVAHLLVQPSTLRGEVASPEVTEQIKASLETIITHPEDRELLRETTGLILPPKRLKQFSEDALAAKQNEGKWPNEDSEKLAQIIIRRTYGGGLINP